MQYLFFDIEASEGRSMCSFGYVLTDSSFNVIAKEDILINPEARFCTQAWNKKKREEGKGITLAYPEKTFRKSPTFPQRYDKIKYLLEREDQMIIGFSHSNDVRYLCTACKRYKLPFFNYSFFDVQDVYREYSHTHDQISLEKIIAELGVNIDGYTLHRSDDDAEISMLVAQAICNRSSLCLDELIKKYSRYVGETHDGEIKYNGIDSERATIKKARNACRGVVANFANNVKVTFKKGYPLCGKVICAGSALEKDDWIFALKLIGCLAEQGTKYVSNIHNADYYVIFGEDEGENGDRLSYIKKNLNGKIKVITKEELFNMMKMTEADIFGFSSPKIDKLSAQTTKYVNKILKSVTVADKQPVPRTHI